jgi:hypothetical protein
MKANHKITICLTNYRISNSEVSRILKKRSDIAYRLYRDALWEWEMGRHDKSRAGYYERLYKICKYQRTRYADSQGYVWPCEIIKMALYGKNWEDEE